MLTVPYEMKADRSLYVEWTNKFCKSDYPSTFKFGAKANSKIDYFFRRCINHLYYILGRKNKFDMNPFQYWERINIEMVDELANMYARDMKRIEGRVEAGIYEILQKDWEEAKLNKKINVLTTTWALCKLYQDDYLA